MDLKRKCEAGWKKKRKKKRRTRKSLGCPWKGSRGAAQPPAPGPVQNDRQQSSSV